MKLLSLCLVLLTAACGGPDYSGAWSATYAQHASQSVAWSCSGTLTMQGADGTAALTCDGHPLASWAGALHVGDGTMELAGWVAARSTAAKTRLDLTMPDGSRFIALR